MHVIQSKDHANSADDARRNDTGMRELRVQTQRAKNQQQKKDIGLNDSRQEFLARGEFKRGVHGILERQRHLGAVESRNGSPVQLLQQIFRRIGDQIDHFGVQGFFFRERLAFRNGFFRKFGVASAPFRETSKKRSGVLVDFLAKRFVNLHGKRAADGDDRGR